MKKVYNDRFKETYYVETLDNGLKVVLWEKPGFQKSFFLLATHFGAFDIVQIDENEKVYEFKKGIAHFLEHKMFEKEKSDVMDEFTRLGADCNAFTSYSETAYYFSTSEDPIKPLNLLLDFVQSLEISDSSVEKEKGIILQELEMYMQMSDSRILYETMGSLYENHPLRYDIAGDKESVSTTTKKDLMDCFELQYHPSNMILVGVSGYDCTKLMKTIKNNQKQKEFANYKVLKTVCSVEPKNVVKENHTVFMDVNSKKVCLAFKLPGIVDSKSRNKIEWCYKLLLDMYFSSMNPDYQRWIDLKIINNSFSFEIDLGKDYGFLLFYSECEDEYAFKKLIIDVFTSITSINSSMLEQLKRRYYGVSISALESMKQIAITYMRTYFENLDFFTSIMDLESIKDIDILNQLQTIDLMNCSLVTICPKK